VLDTRRHELCTGGTAGREQPGRGVQRRVFAIALTLLALDLHSDASRGHFAHALLDQWQSYVAYLAAFLNISAIWNSHHDVFTRVRRVDVRLIVANLGLLLVSSPEETLALSEG
jgi:hypothetical protein